MSFSHNPYRHMDVVVGEHGEVSLRCDSCGGELEDAALTLSASINTARVIMNRHVRQSHRCVPSDFEGWD